MQSVSVQEISPADTPSLKRFTVLERRLMGKYPLFTSRFDSDVIRELSGRSAFTRGMEIAPFIATGGNGDVARCAALINPAYQAAKQEKVGFIGYFASAPGCEPQVQAMLDCAQEWLQRHGVRRIIAPFNTNALLGFGVLTAANDEESVIPFGWNPAYYAAYFTQAGYRPTYPMLVYTVEFSAPGFQAAAARAEANRAFTVRPINMKRWLADLDIIRKLINEAFVNEWEWYPTSLEAFDELFSSYKMKLDPGLMLIAEVQGKPAGVCIAIPNWDPLLRRFQGKLGLPQMAQFLLRGGRYASGGLVFGAVRPECRGMGMGQALLVSACRTYEKRGLNKAYGFTVNVDNMASRRMLEAIGGVGQLLYHGYDKVIG